MSNEIMVDDETRAALLLFNERLDAQRAEERARKRIAKAERAKDEAAKRVRNLTNDPKATAEAREEAEAAYKAAAAELTRVQENPDEEPARKPKAKAQESDDEPAEVSADEEPPATEASSDESDDAE